MSNDGASLGINAERALETILGGKDAPEPEEQATREQVRKRLAQAPRLAEIHLRIVNGKKQLYYHGRELNLGYGECTDVAARAVLEYLETHPEHQDAPAEMEYDWTDFDGEAIPGVKPKILRVGLYELMNRYGGVNLGMLGLTVFMWGFAYNTARWLRYEETAANPAIVDV